MTTKNDNAKTEEPAVRSTYDVNAQLISIQGKKYLPVAARLVWFREEHPDWGIVTKLIEVNLDKQYAMFRAEVINPDGKIIGSGTKMENVKGFRDYIEKAETGAIGRALAIVGYGTQFAPELEEGERLADAPQATSNGDPFVSSNGDPFRDG